MYVSKRGSKRPRTDSHSRETQLLEWLRGRGARVSGVELRPDAWGGLGVFATGRGFAAGERVVHIPERCVLTPRCAAESAAGKRIREVAADATNEEILLLAMCLGRANAAHEWHDYLATLPAQAPDPLSWSDAQLARLAGTDFGVAIAAARREVARIVAVGRALSDADAVAFPLAALDAPSVRWARGMYRSRRLPSSLAARTQGDDEGVLVPFLDFFNHRADAGSEVLGGKANGGVSVIIHTNGTVPSYGSAARRPAAAAAAISDTATASTSLRSFVVEEGEEICIHYGARTNQDLLLNHGFALRDNVHDTVRLALGVRDEESGRQRELGPFHVSRDATNPIPLELWRALADPLHWRPLGVGEEAPPPEVGMDEVAMLIATLERKLATLVAPPADDDGAISALDCAINVSIRDAIDGHRRILSGAIAVLTAIVDSTEAAGGSASSGSESESGSDCG